MNAFPTAEVELENPNSKEEDEEIEEQKRRQKELGDLLNDGIDAFRYDDSTLNSTSTSTDGGAESKHENCKITPLTTTSLTNLSDNMLEQNYRDANQSEQYKILYEVRTRELNNLRNEFESYETEKAAEIRGLKQKLTLMEAENRRSQLSVTSLESLLVEKTESTKSLNQAVNQKDNELKRMEKYIEELKIEISTYGQTVNELQMKLALNNHPFSKESRTFQMDELIKGHEKDRAQLEILLEEKERLAQILEKDKRQLEAQLKTVLEQLVETEKENNFTVINLSKKLQHAQQETKDLFYLGEAIKKECDHFKGRLSVMQKNNSDFANISGSTLDKDTMIVHLEKLRRMLLDKDTELQSLQSKLKFYESDIDELFQYRDLMNKTARAEIKSCNQKEHSEQLVLMQQQLENYKQLLEDRNQEILSLHLINKESREKIEEMLLQTRTDIQNLSNRYSLPQLEKMAADLKNAEDIIARLQSELATKDEQLIQTNLELENLQKNYKELERILDQTQTDLTRSSNENKELKASQEQNRVVNETCHVCRSAVQTLNKLQKDIAKFKHSLQISDSKGIGIETEIDSYALSLDNLIKLFNTTERIVSIESDLEAKIGQLTNSKLLLEGEKVTLENQICGFTKDLDEARIQINDLTTKNTALEKLFSDYDMYLKNVQEDLDLYRDRLKLAELDKQMLEIELEKIGNKANEGAEKRNNGQSVVDGAGDHLAKANLVTEAANDVKEIKSSAIGNKVFDQLVQAEVLKAELALRESLRDENMKNLQHIEEKYKTVLKEKFDLYQREIEKYKVQENAYKHQINLILAEYTQNVNSLEGDNMKMKSQIELLLQQYELCQKDAEQHLLKLKEMTEKSQNDLKEMNRKWEKYVENCILGYVGVEKKCRSGLKKMETIMKKSQDKINAIEEEYKMRVQGLGERPQSPVFLHH